MLEDTFVFGAGASARTWRYRLQRCAGCGLGRLQPPPDDETLDALYSGEYGAYAPPPHRPWLRRAKIGVAQVAARAHWPRRGSLLTPAASAITRTVELVGARTVPLSTSYPLSLSPTAAILDFGCGWGWWLREVRRAGYVNLWGLDREHAGLARLRQEGFHAISGDLRALPAAAFDCIRLEHVLEHIRDPGELLRGLVPALRPGGMIVATVPDFASEGARQLGRQWPALCLPHHLSHFTSTSLRLVCRAAGLEVIREQSLPVWEAAQGPDRPRPSWRARVKYHAEARRQARGDYLSVCLATNPSSPRPPMPS